MLRINNDLLFDVFDQASAVQAPSCEIGKGLPIHPAFFTAVPSVKAGGAVVAFDPSGVLLLVYAPIIGPKLLSAAIEQRAADLMAEPLWRLSIFTLWIGVGYAEFPAD